MKKEKENIPALWKDMTQAVSLDDYADQLTRRMADQPTDLSHLGDDPLPWGWDLETIEAAYDPDRVGERYRQGEYVFNKQRADSVNANVSRFAAKPGDREPYYYFVPDGSGGHRPELPIDLKQQNQRGLRNDPGAYTASGKPPPGAEFGAHGHPDPTFRDDLRRTKGYGDHMAHALPTPMPMATVVTLQSGPHKGQQIVGYREMVNGRLQFRAPVGALSDTDRRAIQANLNAAQTKFYKP